MYILFIYHMLPHNSGACLYNLKYICCPTTVILASQLWSYNPSPKSWRFSGEKNGSSPGKTTVSALICQRLNCGFFYFRRKNCHAVLDSREQQAIPPDYFDHARSIAIGYPNSRSSIACFLANFYFEHRLFLWDTRSIDDLQVQKKPMAGFL